jgi:hypothetical protein
MHVTQSKTKNTAKILESHRKPLRIVLIGGHTRNARHLIQRGRTVGWKIERHSGEVGGRGTKELRAQIGRADIVVITTQVNSHGSMFLAKDYARRLGRFTTIIRREKFAELEDAIFRFQNNTGREGNRRHEKLKNNAEHERSKRAGLNC